MEKASNVEKGPQSSSTRGKWSLGILNDPHTDEVPGSVLLLSKVSQYNEPLGLRNAPARTSASSFPDPYPPSRSSSRRRAPRTPEKKRTADGKIVLEPQPDESPNDPLNWPTLRRDAALISLGLYCMVGGGMTPILAAGFHDVAKAFKVSVPHVALTTGLYMLGLGVGSVVLSPTAILFGKRPVYLCSAVCFILASVWCALSHSFASLVCGRIFMGISVAAVECLPSATIAEIYFLHEKAYRLGIYTLLLLGGKNLVPLVSAVVIQSLGWRWVFWIVACIVGLCLTLLFLFVPETFWDRTPTPHAKRRHSHPVSHGNGHSISSAAPNDQGPPTEMVVSQHERHAHFQDDTGKAESEENIATEESHTNNLEEGDNADVILDSSAGSSAVPYTADFPANEVAASHAVPSTPTGQQASTVSPAALEAGAASPASQQNSGHANAYTRHFSSQPAKTFSQQLRPFAGRLSHDSWLRVAFRPFILFAYPSILWSTLVYSLSVGWLIVLSESVSTIYQSKETYHFTRLQTGLVYISPFVGGVLGTAVAGKLSDLVVRALARRNGGIYEPEYRLVMAIPIAIFTTVGLMGYGWAAEERDAWIAPTIFFGCISFGCSVGSTTAITFAVDSYRQYAGEALVTLNFSKNVLHGFVFSLFFNKWLDAEGSRDVFIAIGGIQLGCLLMTIPMYIFGKRARMWTVRRNLMEKF
ncbi:MFS general substrate transporter [Piedraia hortae CBS 480.64]|uniref:MFS general substrate transporter n=1 Tax=Piedraia hortae CBS 480.64 TaxID=1314780 RepID=A0A6A7C2G6_9PEZI|nr:MFS general substrate transporter [Piedraia hortae CBS 480.64]